MCRSRNLPRRPRLQHAHLNGHLLDPANLQKSHTGVLSSSETSPAVPYLDALGQELSLLSDISRPRSARGLPQRLSSSFFTVLQLFQLLSKINLSDILSTQGSCNSQSSANSPGDPGTGKRDCHTPFLCSVENEFTPTNKTCIFKKMPFHKIIFITTGSDKIHF